MLSFEPYNSTITLGPGHEPFLVEKPKDGASVPESASPGCFGGGRAGCAWGWSSGAGRRDVTQTAEIVLLTKKVNFCLFSSPHPPACPRLPPAVQGILVCLEL